MDILNNAPENSLNRYTIEFGNVSGDIPSHAECHNECIRKAFGVPINLMDFLAPFKVSGSIGYLGDRAIFEDGKLVKSYKIETGTMHKQAEDYCALRLNHENVKDVLRNQGLDYFKCGEDEYLDSNNDGLVAIFGHPSGNEKEGYLNEENKIPLRMSFGKEKDPRKIKNFFTQNQNLLSYFAMNAGKRKGKAVFDEKKAKEEAGNWLFYDNDTFCGDSGAPVIGRGNPKLQQGYCVKGIHSRAFNHTKTPTNGAQKIKDIYEWINLRRN